MSNLYTKTPGYVGPKNNLVVGRITTTRFPSQCPDNMDHITADTGRYPLIIAFALKCWKKKFYDLLISNIAIIILQ